MTSPTSNEPAKFAEDYEEYFNPSLYLSTYYHSPDGALEEGNMCVTIANHWHGVFSTGNIRGERLLDVGTGPNLMSSIMACRQFKQLYLSDYAACNRRALQDWLTRQPQAHDWTPFFKFYTEKDGENFDWHLCEEILRKAIRDIWSCDVTKKNPIAPLEPEPFDCITTSLCLEAASQDDDSFKSAVNNVISLLKPGGNYIQYGVLNESFYEIGMNKFSCHKITSTLLEQAIKDAGCTIISLNKYRFYGPEETDDKCSDFEGYFFLVARKN